MKKLSISIYGVICYVLFLVVFLYFVAFMNNLFVPKTVSSGATGNVIGSILVNIGLITLFGTAHSVMARESFKKWWTKIVPQPAERSTYVLQASLLLALIMWQWRPLNGVIWQIENPIIYFALIGFSLVGVSIVLLSSFLIDHFELFGLQQVYRNHRNEPMPEVAFQKNSLYKMVRHPLQLGIVILMVSTPYLTVGHLLFAATMIGYIFVGLYFEEKALVRQFGDSYRRYQAEVPMLIPFIGRKRAQVPVPSGD